jgi:hypothetical protein
LFQIRDYPNLEGQVPVFISPRNRVAQLYPQALGSLFFTSYDSQGYGGGNRTRLYKGLYRVIPALYITYHPLHVSCKQFTGTPIEEPLNGLLLTIRTPICACAVLFRILAL